MCCLAHEPAPKTMDAYIPNSRTHTHTHHNPAGLLVHLQRQYNPTSLPMRSQRCTRNPTGFSVRSQAQSGIHPQSLWSPCAFAGMYPQPHGALCAFIGPVRDTLTIPLVSLCIHRDVPTTPLGSLCLHRGFPHSRPHRKPLMNPYLFQFLSLSSNLSVFLTSAFSVFCLRQILSPTLMGPVPSLIHNVCTHKQLVS